MSGRRIWSPRPSYVGQHGDPGEMAEMADAIVRVLREQGPLGARRLRELTDARYWGPGCFSAALHDAQERGRVRRTGRRTYAAV